MPAASGSSQALDRAVFVVDDDDVFRALLVDVLHHAGHDVRPFADARAFLSTFEDGQTGCLLLDLHMPNSSGLELQRELARRNCNLPIVFLSGDGDLPSVVEAMRMGAIDFLEKPIERRRLLACVDAALAKAGATRAARERLPEVVRKLSELTEREREVCDRLILGLASKQIAHELGLSTRTVEHHRAHILAKTGAANVVELAGQVLAARAANVAP